ncbi:hypothetical protein PC121_g8480 [Phytophthora cactorum]|nr:hypothetical protein PC120_g4031 [Phytophthora cactorum]KAG3073934.1 hypothetical protein PC121_g8480 [Phytophthora cactorum]
MTDVARQKLFNVSLLHGRLFRTSHVSLIVSIASVVVVFEQVQSELRHSTTEILSLARKSLAGGCGREEDNEEERKEEDGDTETEDETEEMDNVKLEARRADNIDETYGGLRASAAETLIGQEDGEEEMGEKVEVKVEQPEVNSRNDDDAAVENDGRKGRTEQRVVITNETDVDEGATLCGDEESALEIQGTKTSDARNDTTEVEASMYNQNDANHRTSDVANADSEEKKARECVAETKDTESGADVAISSEKTGRQGRGGEINEDIPALHDTKTVQGEEDEVTEAGATSNIGTQVKQTHSPANLMMEDTNCHKSEETEGSEENKEPGAKAGAKTPRSESTGCVDEEMKQTVEVEATRADAKLPVASDVGSGLNYIFKITTKPDLVQALAPVRKTSLELQQYCAAQFPDYLQDMRNDLRSIEYLQQRGGLDSSGLASSVRLLLDQLRQDCTNYSTQHTVGGCILRNEERWEDLAVICDQIAMWTKQISPGHEQLPADYLTHTIQCLGAFEAQFPNRIPVKLLENIISMAQKTMICTESTTVDNEECTLASSCRVSNSKKRPRTDSNVSESEFKRPACRKSSDPVTLVVAKFALAVSEVKVLVLGVSEVINSAQAIEKALDDMKLATSAANNAVCELLQHTENPDEDIVAHFSSATERMVSTIWSISPHKIKFAWLENTTNELYRLLNLGGSKKLESLLSSCTKLESYLEDNFYEWERGPVATLDVMESRVKRFRSRQLKNKNNVDKKVVRTPKNWSRFTAVGKALSAWMFRALKSKARVPLNFFQELIGSATGIRHEIPGQIAILLVEEY